MMSSQNITVFARIKAKTGKEEETKNALMALIDPTREESGCIEYTMHQSSDDPSLFMFYEIWASKNDLDDHLQKPHLAEFVKKADELLAEPLDIMIANVVK
jgi:quinol monooxygenase YgiN